MLWDTTIGLAVRVNLESARGVGAKQSREPRRNRNDHDPKTLVAKVFGQDVGCVGDVGLLLLRAVDLSCASCDL